MRYFLIAGEASGDLHGANLMKALKDKDSSAVFNFWGGDKMGSESEGLLRHYRDHAIMGFVEVVLKLDKILSDISQCKKHILEFKPDVVVFIDYAGFNLRIAEFCKKHGFRTVYYISPKVWAWKENRAKKLEKYVDELLLIFPFEKEYFKKWKVKSTYVGNPLLDEIAEFKPNPDFFTENKLDNRPIIAVLPGSRRQEVNKMLPIMLDATKKFTGHQLVIAGAPGLDGKIYEPFLNERLKIVFGQTYDLLHCSEIAVVCSGTATLETALFSVPQVCGYAGNQISYWIIKMLANIEYISLVNLNLRRTCITELIQHEMNPKRLGEEIALILPGGNNREKMEADYAELREMLGNKGASERAADIILGH
ncbi:MAG: lipid-A-disaccharide synthase [Bacteroidia bacterium]